MARHPFAKSAIKGLMQAHEDAVFALNIPMVSKDRERLRELIKESIEILSKY